MDISFEVARLDQFEISGEVTMRILKFSLLSSLLLFTLVFILPSGCEKAKDLEQASDPSVADIADTTQAQQKAPSIE